MIRRATPEDAAAVAPLLLIIWKDMELSILQQETEQRILKTLEKAILLPDYRYFYEHLYVEDREGQIAGVVAGYPGEIEPKIEAPWQLAAEEIGLTFREPVFTDAETFPGEWYLDSIVTSPAFRGQGVGTALLTALPEIAKQTGQKVIGLNCDYGNPAAKRLYERFGFKRTANMRIGTHMYEHMQLSI
ncbi:GNAT family N-acetyltransferase [Listeria ilorinensis]|uniref:GNAT family N-acetyltransferase n=1 Tax=Listeria ilorinensis TaxID=2867439 RepID=UPI001EF4C4F3|nr:GNAT family N-acetyltransferase [Listeria ilorinensis]